MADKDVDDVVWLNMGALHLRSAITDVKRVDDDLSGKIQLLYNEVFLKYQEKYQALDKKDRDFLDKAGFNKV